jgi:hypothetical protein
VGNQRSLPAHKQTWTIGKMSRSTAVAPRGVGIAQLGIVIQQTIEISLYHPPLSPFSEYVDYNKDVVLFGHAPEPIEEDKTWRLVGRNTNGIKPYGVSADLISVMERLKLLQTGTIAFQETNLEWHNKSYRDEFQKLLVKAFGAARVDYSATKDKFETSPFKPVGTGSAALGKMVHRVVKTGRDDTGCGRWSYITFNGKENKHITVINTYIV